MDVDDQHRDADEDEHERGQDRDSGDVAGAVAVVRHLAEREDRVHEGRDEETDRELTGLVLEDALHDPRRELAHRELDDHHRDRQHESGQADHRRRDGAEDLGRCVRPTDEVAG